MQANNGAKAKLLRKFAQDPTKISARKLVKAVPGLKDACTKFDFQIQQDYLSSILVKGMEAMEDATNEFLYAFYDANEEHKEIAVSMIMWSANLGAPGNKTLQERLIQDMTRLTDRKFGGRPMASLIYNRESYIIVGGAIQKHLIVAVQNNKKDIIADCFDNDEASFERNCVLYESMTPEDFVDAHRDYDFEKSGYEAMAKKIHSAQLEAMLGLHKPTDICWTCVEKSKFECTACKAAKYCSRECQLEHWDQVHKPTCKPIKRLFQHFEEGLVVMKDAAIDPESHARKYGIRPSCRDLSIAFKGLIFCFLNDMSTPQIPNPNKEDDFKLKGPSMVYFFENVRRLVLEGFWLHQGPRKRILPRQPDHDSACMEYHIVLRAMMYEYTDPQSGEPRFDEFRCKVWEFKKEEEENVEEVEQAEYTDDLIQLTPGEWLFFYLCSCDTCANPSEAALSRAGQLVRKLEIDFLEELRTRLSSGGFARFAENCKSKRRFVKDISGDLVDALETCQE